MKKAVSLLAIAALSGSFASAHNRKESKSKYLLIPIYTEAGVVFGMREKIILTRLTPYFDDVGN